MKVSQPGRQWLWGCSLLPLIFAFLTPGRAVDSPTRAAPEEKIVLTQLPPGTVTEEGRSPADAFLRAKYDGARIVMILPGSGKRVLTEGFHSACDPEISFDGNRMLFAGKREASDDWNIFEMELDGSGVRQITDGWRDCRNPLYQGTFYTIVSKEPWHQITFVSDRAGEMNEYGPAPSTSLYSCRLDGSAVRRLTYNPSNDMYPTLLSDGRLLFSSWQRSTLERGFFGRISLFTSHTDGLDYALFSGDEGRRVKLMPCVTTDRLVVFVESDEVAWDGAGTLASVSLRRNLHSYRPITREEDGLFVTPSPLPDGMILVSRRPNGGGGTHGLYRLDPRSGRVETVFDDPDYHDIQARIVAPRQEPDGHSSVVTEKNPNGTFYCLNVYQSDLGEDGWISRGGARRLRVLEGVPHDSENGPAYLPAEAGIGVSGPGSSAIGIPPLIQKRFLGEIAIEEDGSFNVEVPANTPVQLQLLDAHGMALGSCGWIWVKNRETRGCIGCHEDGESTPENRFVQALMLPSIPLYLPPERRRSVDFRRDVMPIISRRCGTAACHGGGETVPLLDGDSGSSVPATGAAHFNRAYESLLAASHHEDGSPSPFGKYVHPGRARTSPLIWRIFGKNTSRPWDEIRMRGPLSLMPPPGAAPLTEDEKRTLVEWIDLGALWDGIPAHDDRPGAPESDRGGAM